MGRQPEAVASPLKSPVARELALLVSLLFMCGVLAASTPRLLGQAVLGALLAATLMPSSVLQAALLALLTAPALLIAAAVLALLASELALLIALLGLCGVLATTRPALPSALVALAAALALLVALLIGLLAAVLLVAAVLALLASELALFVTLLGLCGMMSAALLPLPISALAPLLFASPLVLVSSCHWRGVPRIAVGSFYVTTP